MLKTDARAMLSMESTIYPRKGDSLVDAIARMSAPSNPMRLAGFPRQQTGLSHLKAEATSSAPLLDEGDTLALTILPGSWPAQRASGESSSSTRKAAQSSSSNDHDAPLHRAGKGMRMVLEEVATRDAALDAAMPPDRPCADLSVISEATLLKLQAQWGHTRGADDTNTSFLSRTSVASRSWSASPSLRKSPIGPMKSRHTPLSAPEALRLNPFASIPCEGWTRNMRHGA